MHDLLVDHLYTQILYRKERWVSHTGVRSFVEVLEFSQHRTKKYWFSEIPGLKAFLERLFVFANNTLDALGENTNSAEKLNNTPARSQRPVRFFCRHEMAVQRAASQGSLTRQKHASEKSCAAQMDPARQNVIRSSRADLRDQGSIYPSALPKYPR